jgi:hypothetical protein
MNRRPGTSAPAHYELRVAGHLDEHWSLRFNGVTQPQHSRHQQGCQQRSQAK